MRNLESEFVCFEKFDNFAPLKHGEVAQLVRASDSYPPEADTSSKK